MRLIAVACMWVYLPGFVWAEDQSLDTAVPLPAPPASYYNTGAEDVTALETYRMLDCIQQNAPSNLFFNPGRNKATCMIRAMAKAMEFSFIRHKMTNAEIALFLSQSLEESYFLTKMTETTNMGSQGDGSCHNENAALTQMVDSVIGSTIGLVTTKIAGPNIGAGPLMITGMDNRISAIDYVVQELIMQKTDPEWDHDWTFTIGNKTEKILRETSSEKTLMRFRNWYRDYRKGIDINIYNVLKRPELMTTPGLIIKDPKIEGAMDSAFLMSEFSMAYWHGRCGGEMGKIANIKKAKSKYGPSNFDSREDYLVRAATKCVKGSDRNKKDISDRTAWYKFAKMCVDKYMKRNANRY